MKKAYHHSHDTRLQRNRNLRESIQNQHGIDIISNLPESIRNYIVSKLPMVDAVRTSILSKSWRNVCASLSNLEFDHKLFDEMSSKKTGFAKSISRLLDCRDASAIESFKLSIDVDDSTVGHIHSWVSFAVQHNVKELSLFVLSGKLDSLPCCLFTSTTLMELCLSNVSLNLPSLVEFPMIKRLTLDTIEWSDDKETNQLISSCPLLEELSIVDCSWNKSNLLVISAPNLKRLVFKTVSPPREVRISSTKICYCDYVGNPPDISLESLSSFLTAKFCFSPSLTKPSHDRVSKILMGMQNVVDLLIVGDIVGILARDWDLLSKNSTGFGSIKVFGLLVFSTKNQIQFVSSFLKLFSNLQTLAIFFKEDDHYGRLLDIKDNCQPHMPLDLGALEVITICECNGSDDELDLVSHLLQYSKALKVMRFIYSDELDYKLRRAGISKKIENFVKASPLATISFFGGVS